MLEKLDRLDKIVVNQSDLEKVSKWYSYHYDDLRASEELNIPFEECVIEINPDALDRALKFEVPKEIIEEMESYGSVKIHFSLKNEDGLDFALYFKGDEQPILEFTVDESFSNTGRFNWKSPLKTMKDEFAQEQAKVYTLIAFELFAYISNVTENIIEKKISKSVKKKPKKKTGSKKPKQRQVRISVTRYEIDFERSESSQKYQRHTDAWTVRGHWRYYKKTGKKVWIKPYKKGQGEIDKKIYTV